MLNLIPAAGQLKSAGQMGANWRYFWERQIERQAASLHDMPETKGVIHLPPKSPKPQLAR
jgi:hypothetical protein